MKEREESGHQGDMRRQDAGGQDRLDEVGVAISQKIPDQLQVSIPAGIQTFSSWASQVPQRTPVMR